MKSAYESVLDELNELLQFHPTQNDFHLNNIEEYKENHQNNEKAQGEERYSTPIYQRLDELHNLPHPTVGVVNNEHKNFSVTPSTEFNYVQSDSYNTNTAMPFSNSCVYNSGSQHSNLPVNMNYVQPSYYTDSQQSSTSDSSFSSNNQHYDSSVSYESNIYRPTFNHENHSSASTAYSNSVPYTYNTQEVYPYSWPSLSSQLPLNDQVRVAPKFINTEVSSTKSKRATYSVEQLAVLNKEFELNKYPKRNRMLELAEELNFTHIQINSWFINRRVKERLGQKKQKLSTQC